MPAVVSIVWNLDDHRRHRPLPRLTRRGRHRLGHARRHPAGGRHAGRRGALPRALAVAAVRARRSAAAPRAAAHGAHHHHARDPQLQRAHRHLVRAVRERPRRRRDRLRVPPLPAPAGDLRRDHRHGAVPVALALRGAARHGAVPRHGLARRAPDGVRARCRSSRGSRSCPARSCELVYQRGNFDAAATVEVAGALAFFSVGLVFANANIMLNRVVPEPAEAVAADVRGDRQPRRELRAVLAAATSRSACRASRSAWRPSPRSTSSRCSSCCAATSGGSTGAGWRGRPAARSRAPWRSRWSPTASGGRWRGSRSSGFWGLLVAVVAAVVAGGAVYLGLAKLLQARGAQRGAPGVPPPEPARRAREAAGGRGGLARPRTGRRRGHSVRRIAMGYPHRALGSRCCGRLARRHPLRRAWPHASESRAQSGGRAADACAAARPASAQRTSRAPASAAQTAATVQK